MSTVKQVDECEASSPPLPEKSQEPLSLTSEVNPTPNNGITHSPKTIGPPLQTSSPFSIHDFRPECNGEGDSHSSRTVHNLLLSPIRYTKSNQQVTFATFETPPSSPSPHPPANAPAPTTLESFVTNFEKSSTKPKPSQLYSPEQEFLLNEKVSNMEESEAKKLLAKVLIDNIGLRQELRTKEKRITAYKGQMLAILDWKARQDVDDEYYEDERNNNTNTTNTTNNVTSKMNNPFISSGGIKMATGIARHHRHRLSSSFTTGIKEESDSDSEKNMTPPKTIHSTEEITVVEEMYGVRRSLSIIQELASSIEMDQELLKERLKHGCYLTNQMIVGGIAGWMSALFVKKFGKLALSATGGGIILLVYTARKGFVNVNYDSIYQEISRFCDTVDNQCLINSGHDMQNYADYSGVGVGNANFEGSFDGNGSRENLNDNNDEAENLPNTTCSYDKLKQAKNWISSHTYTMGGFVLSFVYNLI